MSNQGKAETPRLRPDLPADHDAFGAHRAIARAIKCLIETNPDHGYGIALIGERGSGKSTVIKLLEKECCNKTILVFKFDAWAHEGDKLRRAFLEELSSTMADRGWLDPWWVVRWLPDRYKRFVRGRRAHTFSNKLNTATHRSFSGLTITALLAASWIALKPGLLTDWADRHSHWYWALLIVTILSLVLDNLVWLKSGILALSRSASFSVAAPAATSIEFRRQFDALAKLGALGLHNPDRALVIALEDLDRLGENERRKAFAVMRTFTDGSANLSGTLNRIWTIVPFRGHAKGHATQESVAASSSEWDEGRMEKICQIRFAVPPPVITGWRAFLTSQIADQIPNWTAGARDIALQVYTEQLAYQTLGRTPRRMRGFVNQLVTFLALCEYPQQATPECIIRLAANTLCMGTAVDPLKMVGSTSPATTDTGDIAALLFNLPKEKALQAVYEEPVTRALRAGDSNVLSALAADCANLADIVLTLIQRDAVDWAKRSPRFLGFAALALQRSENALSGLAGASLAQAAASVQQWNDFDELAGRGLGLLCAAQPNLAQGIFNRVARAADLGLAMAEADAVRAFVQALVKAAAVALPAELRIGRTHTAYLDFIFGLHQQQPFVPLTRYRPACDPGQTVKWLVEAASRDEVWLNRVTAANLAGLKLVGLSTELSRDLLSSPTDNSLQMAASAAALTMLWGKYPAERTATTLTNIRADGRIFALLAGANQGTRISAALMLAVLATKPELENYGSGGARADGANRFAVLVAGTARDWGGLVDCARDAGLLVPLKSPHLAVPRSAWYPLLEYMVREIPKSPEDHGTGAGA